MGFLCCGSGTAAQVSAGASKAKAKAKAKGRKAKAKAKALYEREAVSVPAAELIQGVLHLDVLSARNLPNMDSHYFRGLLQRETDVTDPYVTVDTISRGKKTARLIKTAVIKDSLNPHWNETFNIPLCHEAESFFFAVKDIDLIATAFVGSMSLSMEDVTKDDAVEGWFPLERKGGQPAGELQISLRFTPADKLTRTNEVPGSVFPMRTGCAFVPYQNAHTPAVPPITDVIARDGKPYEPSCLWLDTLKAIREAEKFVYIWGWAVWAELEMDRTNDSEKWETLGEVLIKKAKEGVRVLVMVWDEAMSTDVYPVGLMGTHDEQTEDYFKDTDVEVFKCPRKKAKARMFDAFMATTTYTHHQKGVLVDAAVPAGRMGSIIGRSNSRRVVGFMGGIDLTDGRYDTPEHDLFATLKTKHRNDFYCNVTLDNTAESGPRQPWRDIHCYYEGPIAMDLLANFQNRWLKQNPEKKDSLLSITEEDGFDLKWSADKQTSKDGSSWNMQLFRSINSDSVEFSRETKTSRLMGRKGRLYEDSIQKAYIHHIRRAKKYIYLENQYFLGSCHSWLNKETLKAPNLVPLEICARVERAIAEGEDFRAYICIPLHPEGDPTSAAVQEILRWQSRTQEMMLDRIARAIHAKEGLEAHPTDYIMFFAPAKQEGPEEVPKDLTDPNPETIAAKSRSSLRYMIYVHSKLAIFDDEYIIMGSANINERSLSGNRDTEMCVGAFQPAFTKETAGEGMEIKGDVRTFRLAIWAAHCGKIMPEHQNPASLECMKAMKALGYKNLTTYIADEPCGTESRLLSYPLEYGVEGSVSSRKDCVNFPDTGGLIIGKASDFLPNSITT